MGIFGYVFVTAMVFGGYVLHGGNLMIMVQPTEYMVIFGAALGATFVMVPLSTWKSMVGMCIKALTGGGPGKKDYLDLLTMLFKLFQIFRKNGPQAVEKHIEDPKNSDIFKENPAFLKNHHAVLDPVRC
jgi:chemotaxis protein MotA